MVGEVCSRDEKPGNVVAIEEQRESKHERLKVFRLKAICAGFKKAWRERDYATIVTVARKIPKNVLQEDFRFLM